MQKWFMQDGSRELTLADGTAFAKAHGCLFCETSAKADVAVKHAFEELILKILDSPTLLNADQGGTKLGLGGSGNATRTGCC